MAACFAAPSAQNPAKALPNKTLLFRSSLLRPLSMTLSRRPSPISALASIQKNPPIAATTSRLSADARHRDDILQAAGNALSNCLSETHLDQTVPGLHSKGRGKVRDVYDAGEHLVLVTTDRQSAFDRFLASIPFKGQVLNETSLWWFNKTQHITPNAVVSAPDRNVTIAKKCCVFPVEFVVRGYVTGSTDTSLWTVYSKGSRNYCGNVLPEGMVKNEKLPANILTPTTKAVDHDVPVSPDEIIRLGLMTQTEFDEVKSKALALFSYGQQVALENGLILVDTKYEFGKAADGTIMLIDESFPRDEVVTENYLKWSARLPGVFTYVHTPDSSRYWIANSYERRFNAGLEPENVDKEFLRLWFKEHCNPYEDEVLPEAPKDLVCELAWRYIFLFETITDSNFQLPVAEEPIHDRISKNVSKALSFL